MRVVLTQPIVPQCLTASFAECCSKQGYSQLDEKCLYCNINSPKRMLFANGLSQVCVGLGNVGQWTAVLSCELFYTEEGPSIGIKILMTSLLAVCLEQPGTCGGKVELAPLSSSL